MLAIISSDTVSIVFIQIMAAYLVCCNLVVSNTFILGIRLIL